MNSLIFIGVSFYLFPEEAEALDAHAANVVARLTQESARPRPVMEAFDTGSISGGFGEGKRDLWRGTESALFVFRYGDTALLVALCPPRKLGAADGPLPSLVAEESGRWGSLFTKAQPLPPYQSACVHVFEFEGGAEPAPVPRAGDMWARVTDEGGDGGGGFLWKLVGENEHLVVAAEGDPWLHEWCFERAHLFRLLLFHGKAHRYFEELLQVDALGSKRKAGRFSQRQLQSIARKESNLEIAAKNFEAEWRTAVPGLPTSLGDFFAKAHESWRAQALKISREAEASAAWADEQSAAARRKPMSKADKLGGAQRDLEVEIKLRDGGRVPSFDRDTFRGFWERRYRGKSGDMKESARGLSFTWRGVRHRAVVIDAENGLIDRVVADSGGDALYELREGGVQLYQYVPEVKLKPHATRSVLPGELIERKGEVELAVMVVTPTELDAALHFLRPWPGERAVLMGHLGNMTYHFGRFGNYRAALFESGMGSVGSQAATLSAQQAITDFSPKALLMVGIAFGVNRAKQNMGDVLVAESIRYYGHVKTGPTKVTQRGFEYTCGEILSERFKTLRKSWRLDAGGRRVQVHQGVVLSADNLLNNLAARDRLVRTYPQAVGGEMEGSGVYAAAKRAKTEMILVKAICDWADGHKNDRAQPFAAYAAASLASHVLGRPGALAALGAEDIGRGGTKGLAKRPSQVPAKKPAKGSAKERSNNVIHTSSTPATASPARRVAAPTSAAARSAAKGGRARRDSGGPSGTTEKEPVELFYSYSHRDKALRDKLATHLSLLTRQGLVSGWHDRHITASREWEGEISSHLDTADVILLLVSPDFIASDYIYDVELKRAMERHESGAARVVPVILRPCDWHGAPFSKLQALPENAKPVTTWADRDRALADIAKGIRLLVEELHLNHRGPAH